MASESTAIIRTYQGVGAIAQFDPAVMDNFDHDEAAEKIAEGFGTPATIVRGAKEVQEARQHRATMHNFQTGAALADSATKSVKQLADASKSGSQAAQVQQQTGGNSQANVAQIIDMLRTAIRGNRAA